MTAGPVRQRDDGEYATVRAARTRSISGPPPPPEHTRRRLGGRLLSAGPWSGGQQPWAGAAVQWAGGGGVAVAVRVLRWCSPA